MMRKMSLEREIRYILTYPINKEYMNQNAKTLTHRLTPMVIALFLDEEIDTRTVNTWLFLMGEPRLNIRNIESIFAFVYERYKSFPKEVKVEKFEKLYSVFSKRIKETMVDREFKTIVTLGDLCRCLEEDSETKSAVSTKTYNTRNDTANIIFPEFNKFVQSKDSDEIAFEKYLNFLSERQAGYQQKSTYFLRRMLYQIITRGPRLLYDRDEFAYTKGKNKEVRHATLSIIDGEAFNKFLDCNSMCLSDIKWVKSEPYSTKSLKGFLGYNKENDTFSKSYDECKEWLLDKKILYGELMTDFFELYCRYDEKAIEMRVLEENLQYDIEGIPTGKLNKIKHDEYQILFRAFSDKKNDMVILEEKEDFDPLSNAKSISTAEFLLKQLFDFKKKENRKTYVELLKNMVSGTYNVSRRMLVLFASFAGYSEQEINELLNNCGFEEMDNNNFDNAIKEVLKTSYNIERGWMYNDGIFLKKTLYPEKKDKIKSEIREKYKEHAKKLYEQLVLLENDTSIPSVAEIFKNEWLKNVLEKESMEMQKMEDNESLKKIMKKM